MGSLEARFKRAGMSVFSRGPSGTARLDGDALLLAYDAEPPARILLGELKKVDFNTMNGLWTLHPREGKKLVIQTTGRLFSVGDRSAGKAFNDAFAASLEQHGVPIMSV